MFLLFLFFKHVGFRFLKNMCLNQLFFPIFGELGFLEKKIKENPFAAIVERDREKTVDPSFVKIILSKGLSHQIYWCHFWHV